MKLIVVFVLVFNALLKITNAQQVIVTADEILHGHPYFNKQIPMIVDTALNGNIIDFKAYQDKVLVVHFWSLTCSGCYKEIPELNLLANEYKSKDVVIISCMYETSAVLREKIANDAGFYILKKPVYGNDKIRFEIIPDANSLRKVFGSSNIPPSGVPITYVLKNNVLKDISYGYMMQMGVSATDATANYERLKGMIEGQINKLEGKY